MRRPSKKSPLYKRRLVGVLIDGVSSYGRGVLRGVMRYANLEHQWLLHNDFRSPSISYRSWPRCDGAIVAGIAPEALSHIRKICKQVVICSGSGDPTKTSVVALDDPAAGATAAEHLIGCRLEHFAFYGTSSYRVAALRLQGFKEYLVARGKSCIVAPVAWPSGTGFMTHTHWPELIAWLRSLPKPVGIMAADDSAAHDLASACLSANVPVPDEVAIIGVNNDDLLCDSTWPPLSSVIADYSRMGYEAARILDNLMREELDPSLPQLTLLPPVGVAARQSTNVLAVQDANLAAAIRFIQEHAADPCTVADVLRHVPVGRRWLERQFARAFGRTLHEDITRARIETAKRLLLQSDRPLSYVANRCGYAAESNFYHAFQKIVGVTPAVYRRQRNTSGT